MLKKRGFLTLFLVICSNSWSHSTQASLFKVVIDPGHGGSDEGTVFLKDQVKITEKEITLKLAQKVARYLKSKGYQVALTRTKDQELPLPDRTAFANRIGADVFISLHMNSTSQSNPHRPKASPPEGIETFILNHASDASSRRLAKLENSVITPRPSTSEKATSEDKDVALILKDLRLDGNLSESKRLACQIQSHLVHATSKTEKPGTQKRTTELRRNRGVKQALFHVLLGADMPSVLVEAGFLTSARDRSLVLSQKGLSAMSQSIANAVDQFKRHRTKTYSKMNNCKVY